MPEREPDSIDKVIVTAGEITRVGAPLRTPPPIAWWAIAASSVLVVCLPLLCLYAIVMRAAMRQSEGRIRNAWTRLLCTLLIASGLATSLAVGYFWGVSATPVPVQFSFGLDSLDGMDAFPSLPSGQPMTAAALAAALKPLVFIAAPDPGRPPQRNYLETASIGAATLLTASPAGYLLATNRHVVEEPGLLKVKNSGSRILLFSSKGDYASAEVVARHHTLDLAVLWIGRKSGEGRFRQAITGYGAIPVGEPVFVLGHPQRLFFTISNGLISRREGGNLLQLSAPISPGNSGGPVYDALGNLLGIVTFMVDKQTSPNAENLNFAVRADALLEQQGWDFQKDAGARLKELWRPST